MSLVNDELLRALLQEGLLPAISVWKASFSPNDRTTTCEAMRFHGWDDYELQFGASEHIQTVIHHDAIDTGEDGIEPAYDETLDYYFLRLEDPNSRDQEQAATHETELGTIESIDVLVGSYKISRQEGIAYVEVLAGLRVNLTEGYHGDAEASFGFLQRHPTRRIDIGPASIIFRDLPAHIRIGHRVTLTAS